MAKKKEAFKKPLTLGIQACLFFFLLTFGSVFWSYNQSQDSFDWAFHSQEVLTDLSNLLSHLQDAETGQRGFILTENESYLEPYNKAITLIQKDIQNLRSQTADNPFQQKKLTDIEKLVEEKREELRETIDFRRTKGLEAALAVVKTGRGKKVMDDIRQLVAEMEQEEYKLIKERKAQASNSSTLSIAAQFMGIVLILIMGFFVFRGMKRASIEQALIEEEITRANQDLEQQNWLKTNLATLNDKMRGDQVLVDLAQNIISGLADMMEGQIGAVFLAEESGVLKMVASYGYTHRKNISNEYQVGESLVGQAALEKKSIVISNVPEDYVRVTSGLGEARPKSIMVVPFLYEDMVMGVMELGSFHPFNDRQLELLNQAGDSIAIVLNSALARRQAAELLSETQAQAEELISQKQEMETIQEELQQTNQSLEQQASDLAQQKSEIEEKNALVKLKMEELEVTGAYKSEFLANMSHELRTPLNSLLILSKLLAENKEQNLTEKQIEFIQTINSSGSDLLDLINDMLDLSKVEAGKMELHLEEVGLSALADSAKKTFLAMAEQKGLHLKIEISEEMPSHIQTDFQRVEQVIKNLMSNAFKFTEKGGILLKFHSVESGVHFSRPGLNDKNTVGISVSDTGKGIPKEKQKQIFESFQQEDGTTSRKYGGTGLGLSISKELVRLLGGEIKLESEEGAGSTFTIYLPKIFSAPESLWNQEEIKALESGSKTVLIVEDDIVMRKSISELLGEENIHIIEIETAQDALKILKTQKIDCMILDLGLRGMSGFELLRDIQSQKSLSSIHIIIYTGKDLSKQQEKELSALSKSIIIKGAKSPERLLDETRLFLHGVKANLDKKDQPPQSIFFGEGNLTFQDKKVLLVDDDIRNIFALTHLLEEKGVDVVTAGNGREALETLQSNQDIDLILMDIMMPEMDGYEAIKEIRKNKKYKDIPIIALTAKAMKNDRKKCLDAGASDYLTKPIDQTKLFTQLNVWLQK